MCGAASLSEVPANCGQCGNGDIGFACPAIGLVVGNTDLPCLQEVSDRGAVAAVHVSVPLEDVREIEAGELLVLRLEVDVGEGAVGPVAEPSVFANQELSVHNVEGSGDLNATMGDGAMDDARGQELTLSAVAALVFLVPVDMQDESSTCPIPFVRSKPVDGGGGFCLVRGEHVKQELVIQPMVFVEGVRVEVSVVVGHGSVSRGG